MAENGADDGVNEPHPDLIPDQEQGRETPVKMGRRRVVGGLVKAGIGAALFGLGRSSADQGTQAPPVEAPKAAEKLVDFDGWDIILKPPTDATSRFLALASGEEMLSPQRNGQTKLERNFTPLVGGRSPAPLVETRWSVLAPINPALKPKMIAQSGEQTTVVDIDLPAFRYNARPGQIEGFQKRPVLVSPINLEPEHSETLNAILETTRAVFSPFTNSETSHQGFFDTYVVPGSPLIGSSRNHNEIFLGLDAITKPSYERRAEIETFATAAHQVLVSQVNGDLLKPETQKQVGIISSRWRVGGGLGELEPVLKPLFARRTYVNETGGSAREGFTPERFSKVTPLADALTIMRYFPDKFIEGFAALPPAAQEIARERLNVTLAVLNDWYPNGTHQPNMDHWTSLVPKLSELIIKLGLNPIRLTRS